MPIDFRTQLEENLKRRLPEFQRGNVALDEYLETAGKFLDELRDAIDRIKFSKDYENSSIQQLTEYAEEIKVEFPSDIADETLRLAVRDIVSIYRFKGTEKTLKWIFDVIGLPINIRYAWILNPDEFDPPVPSNVDSETFIYGNERVFENGTYFTGQDIFGNAYNKIPILGERYPNNKRLTDHRVIKTPYVFIEIDSRDYDDFVEDIDTEDQTLLDEIIKDYFDEIRPANVALVVLVTIPEFQDQIDYDPEETLDVETTELPKIDATWAIGFDTNPYRFYEFYERINIGQDKKYVPYREEFQRMDNVFIERTVDVPDFVDDLHIRSNVLYDVQGTINSGSLTIQSTNDSRFKISRGEHTWNDLETFTSNIDVKGALIDQNKGRVITSSDFDGDVTLRLLQISPLIPTTFINLLGTVFGRDSEAYNIGPDGNMFLEDANELRQGFNPYNTDGNAGDYLGYHIEPEAINYVLNSQVFFDPWVSASGGNTIPSSQASPDPLSNMFEIFRESGSNTLAGVEQVVSIDSDDTIHTASVFAKPKDSEFVAFSVESGDFFSIIVLNTDTGSIDETASDPAFENTSVYYQRFQDDIYRMFFQFNTPVEAEDVTIRLIANHNGSSVGNGTYFWGAQLERQSGTTYIPTSSDATAQRESDDIIIETIPSNLIELENDEDLLVMMDFSVFGTAESLNIVRFLDENDNFVQVATTDSGLSFNSNMFDNFDYPVQLNNTKRNNIIPHKVMIAMENVNNGEYRYKFYYNNQLEFEQEATALQGTVKGLVGNESDGSNTFNGHMYNVYFGPMKNDEFIEDKYGDLLQLYRTLGQDDEI